MVGYEKMLNYVVVPNWLRDKLIKYSLPIDTVLDVHRLTPILSREELYFYIHNNSVDWSKTQSPIGTGKLLNRLSMMGDNYVRANFIYDEPLASYHSQVASKSAETKINSQVWLYPCLIGTKILGLVTSTSRPKHSRLRRDIYSVLTKLMSVEDIIRSPVFGL